KELSYQKTRYVSANRRSRECSSGLFGNRNSRTRFGVPARFTAAHAVGFCTICAIRISCIYDRLRTCLRRSCWRASDEAGGYRPAHRHCRGGHSNGVVGGISGSVSGAKAGGEDGIVSKRLTFPLAPDGRRYAAAGVADRQARLRRATISNREHFQIEPAG